MQKMIKKFMITALVIFFAQLLYIVGLVFLSKVLLTFEYIEDILIISLQSKIYNKSINHTEN